MNTPHVPIGSAPYAEECAQLGQPGYEARAQRECEALIGQMHRIAERWREKDPTRTLPRSVELKTMPFEHEYGTYYEVVATYDPSDPVAVQMAVDLSDACPENWDEAARVELGYCDDVGLGEP